MTKISNKSQDAARCMRTVKTRDDVIALLPKHSIGAEVGVFAAEFSRRLIPEVDPSLLFLIDTFVDQWHSSGNKDGLNVQSINTRHYYETVLVPEFVMNTNVKILCGESLSFLNSFPTGGLDWVYIDAAHTYRAVRVELEISKRIIRQGGYICGHDYNIPGVQQAVDEFLCVHALTLDVITEDLCPSFMIKNQ